MFTLHQHWSINVEKFGQRLGTRFNAGNKNLIYKGAYAYLSKSKVYFELSLKQQYYYDSRTKAEIKFDKKSTAKKTPLIMIANYVSHQFYQPYRFYFAIFLSSLDWEFAGLPGGALLFSFFLSFFLLFAFLFPRQSLHNGNESFAMLYS